MSRPGADVGPRIPFGRHRGKPVASLPTKYLNWLAEQRETMPGFLVEAARAELRHRSGLDVPHPDLPRAEPRTVCGVRLDALEAGAFEQALAVGELVLEPHEPVNSPVPEAWRRWCRAAGIPHRVREVRP